MSRSRHLVSSEIAVMLDMPPVELNADTLAEVRANPMFSADELPKPPFPVTEAFALSKYGPDVRLVIQNPPSDDRARGAILHIHGGGMVVGTADTSISKFPLALAHDVPIVSVDYRLAPETPFPGPQEDCYAALCWLADNAADLGVDPARIVVMGESAGGGLAASTAQMARDRAGNRSGPTLAGQVLVYPMLDWRTGGPDCRWKNAHTGEWIWTHEKNRYGWEALRGDYDPIDARKGWFSPALAEDLAGLAPAYIMTGALDLFLDEDVDYARRLVDAGIQVELHVYPGAIHAFEMVPDTSLAAQAAADLAHGLKRLLGSGA